MTQITTDRLNKVFAFGDIHGRTVWKDIVSNNPWDHIIFIGDYFDSHDDISATRQIKNFREILQFKKNHPEKVTLLLGNHDFHYLNDAREDYSGYQYQASDRINKVLQPAVDKGLIQIAQLYGEYLFSHAGVTQTWMNAQGYAGDERPDVFINRRFAEDPGCLRFTMGHNSSPYGDDITQSPIWVRPESLLQDALPGYIQVVGHTMYDAITFAEGKVYFIDTLGTNGEWWAKRI